MSNYDDNKQLKCSFCGKPQDQVKRLIAGPDVYICDECVELCQEIIRDEFENLYSGAAAAAMGAFSVPKPKDIYESLSDYVIGQDEAKRMLAVAVYNTTNA